MKKRAFSFLLTLIMIVGLLPTTVLASTELQSQLDGYATVYAKNNTEWWGTSADFWNAVGMSTYTQSGGTQSLTDDQKDAQACHLVTDAIAALGTPDWNTQANLINTVQSAVNGLAALGFDPNQVTDSNGEAVDLIGGLKTVTDMTAEGMMYYSTIAPYTLLALQQGDYDADAAITAHIDYLTPLVADTTTWWGADSGAMMMQALVPYYSTNDTVKTAIDAAMLYFDTMQSETASFGNAPADAMVMVALSMMGIDVTADDRFISESGATLLDGLMTYELTDGTGFDSRYQDWTSGEWMGIDIYNQRATDQAFLALIALDEVISTGEAFNPFDFTAIEKTTFTLADTDTTPTTPDQGSDDNNDTAEYTAYVTIKTHNDTWLYDYEIEFNKGDMVCDALATAFADNDITTEGLDNGYITAVTKGDTTLEEFGAGPLSGWKYSINGVAPQVGIDAAVLREGDEILLYYMTDHTNDKTPDDKGEEPKEETKHFPFADVSSDCWYYEAVNYAFQHTLFAGTTETTFAPDDAMTRSMLITVLHRISGDTTFTADNSTWYANALTWGLANDITDGTALDSSATREQIVSMLWRLEGQPTVSADLSAYTDTDTISNWATSAVEWAVSEGILSGRNGNTLAPTATATRSETAALLMRYLTK